MNTVYLICFLVAALCFLVAAFVPQTPSARVNLVAFGLFAWVLVPLIQRIDIMNS